MKRQFNTSEAAQRHLEVKRTAAYKRIAKKGWKVLEDRSFVTTQNVWLTEEKSFKNTMVGKLLGSDSEDKISESTMTNKTKWVVMMMITTDEMIKDLMNFKTIDYEQELTEILKETEKINKDIIRKNFKL